MIKTPPNPNTQDGKVYYAWLTAHDIVNQAMDADSRDQYIFWLMSPETPAAAKAAIMEMVNWAGTIWKLYTRTYKVQINAGGDPTLNYIGVCGEAPYTFGQIADLADPPSP
jgi:hypothetical protein